MTEGSSISSVATESAAGAEVAKFKMMMMGDLSAGKSDMMARYFGQDNHSIFAELTAKGMVQQDRMLTISGR